MPDTFQCTLISPENKLFDEPVSYASVPAWDGLVGIAPGRAPLLAKLGEGVLRLDLADGGSRYFYIGGGFVQMQGDVLSILSSSARPASDVDIQQAKELLAEAKETQATSDEQVEQRDRQVRQAQAMMAAAKHG